MAEQFDFDAALDKNMKGVVDAVNAADCIVSLLEDA